MDPKIVQETDDGKFKVFAPFHPDFPEQARALGGDFHGHDDSWIFDARDDARVRAMLYSIFGTDGNGPVDLASARVVIKASPGSSEVWLFGRQIAKRWQRDSRVKLGEGVIIIEGEFPARGGSAKHPKLLHHHGQVLVEIRDVPLSLVLREAEAHPDVVTLVSDEGDHPAIIAVLTVQLTYAQAEILNILRDRHEHLSDSEIVAAALNVYEVRGRKR